MKKNEQKDRLIEIISANQPLELETISEFKDCTYLIIETSYDFMEEGKFELAFKLFNIGIYFNNTHSEMLNGLGITLCELSKFRESKKVLKRAVRLNPGDPITLANLAGVCWETGEVDEAIYYYTKALKVSPLLEDIYANLVNLYIEAGYLYMAFITCLDFLRDFPNDDEAKDLFNEIILDLALSIY